MEGQVKFYKEEKGWGFIVGEDGIALKYNQENLTLNLNKDPTKLKRNICGFKAALLEQDNTNISLYMNYL